MTEWRALDPHFGMVIDNVWNEKAGRIAKRRRRGWRASLYRVTDGKPVRELCGHAHSKKAAAKACGEREARRRNSTTKEQ